MAMDIKKNNSSTGKSDDNRTILDMPNNLKKQTHQENKTDKSNYRNLLTIIIVIAFLAVAGLLLDKYTSLNLLGSAPQTNRASLEYSQDKYHAVFLSNGQVYFGKITQTTQNRMLLEEIYYLQAAAPLQQAPPNQQQQPQLTLVKLGNEIHGPYDHMKINNRHILFVEELKENGKVVTAIEQYKQGDIQGSTQQIQ